MYKKDEKHPTFTGKVLCSAGLGSQYTTRTDAKNNNIRYRDWETYRCKNGAKINLPIYYRNKIYTEEEREKLWLIKLDKDERWICGERVDISKNLDDYYKTLEYYRERNKELGYGNDEKNWEKKMYENQRRNIKKMERIEVVKKRKELINQMKIVQ